MIRRWLVVAALSCASCGAIALVDTGTDCGAVDGSDASAPPCAVWGALEHPDPLRSCNADSDCALRFLPGCCSPEIVVGLAKWAQCKWIDQPCDPTSCGGNIPMYATDDYRLGASPSGIVVRCENGSCRSYGPECEGQPCGDGNACVMTTCGGTTTCSPIPPGCAAGSDVACAANLCALIGALTSGDWISQRDIYCLPCNI